MSPIVMTGLKREKTCKPKRTVTITRKRHVAANLFLSPRKGVICEATSAGIVSPWT